jgi:hypothetical protein
MTHVEQQRHRRPESMLLVGVEVRWELVEWLSWMVEGRTADVLSESMYVRSVLAVLSPLDEEAILAAIDGALEPPAGLTDLREALISRRAEREAAIVWDAHPTAVISSCRKTGGDGSGDPLPALPSSAQDSADAGS